MLSTCGDKRLLSSCLSPHRICTLVCIREMTQWEAWHGDVANASANMNDTLGSHGTNRSYETEMARRNIYIAVYQLTQCAEATSKEEFILELRDKHQCCQDYIDAVKMAMKSIVESPLDSLLELFVILPDLVNTEAVMSIAGTSAIGIYIRQSILAFNRLDFAQIEKVSRKLCDFIEPPAFAANTSNSSTKRFGASKSFVDFERAKTGLQIEDQTVFLRNEPFANFNEDPCGAGDPSNSTDHRQPDSYFSHHLDLMSQSFFRCATDALVSYFSRNFKNRMPDIIVREPTSHILMREMKSKSAICSSRFETILLGYIAGVSGDAQSCRSLLIDATKQCHSAGDIVGVELANLMSLLIFGTELTSPTSAANGSAIRALLDAPPSAAGPQNPQTTSVPLTPEGLKFLAFVNFYKAVIEVLRADEKSVPISSRISVIVNAYLPVIDRASPAEATHLSLVLTQAMSLIYRLHGEVTLAASLDLVTLYMNAEFTPGHFFGTAPVLRAWQDLALNNWSTQATTNALWQRIDTVFPRQPDHGKQLVDLTSTFKMQLMTGEFAGAENVVGQLFSVDRNEAAVLSANFLLESGQFYEFDDHYSKMAHSDELALSLPSIYRLRLELLRGLYFVGINDSTRALEVFDRIILLCDRKSDFDELSVTRPNASTTSFASATPSTDSYRHYGIKALVYLYKSLALLKLGFVVQARSLLESKASILVRVYCSSYVVGQCYYLLAVAAALLNDLPKASEAIDQAILIFVNIDAQPMLIHTYASAAFIAQARSEAKARNVFAHKFLAARQELTERDRIWVDSDVWKLSPFYFIDSLTGSLQSCMKN